MEHCESVASLKKILSRMIVMVDLVRDLNLDFFLFFFYKKSKWVLVLFFSFSFFNVVYFIFGAYLGCSSFLNFYGDGFQLSMLNGFFFGFF